MAQNLFKHIDRNDLRGYGNDDFRGLIATLYRTIYSKPLNEVQVFNPSAEEHNWQSQHTVIILHHVGIRYLIDSIRNTLNQNQIKIHSIFHVYLTIERNQDGTLKSIEGQDKTKRQQNKKDELLLYLEIDRHSRSGDIQEIKQALDCVLRDVEVVATDYPAMSALINEVSQSLENAPDSIKEEIKESRIFLNWLREDHFTFLAYDEYLISTQGIKPIESTALGLFRVHGQPEPEAADTMSANQQEVSYSTVPVIFSKSGHLSSVHRSAYSDYIVIKKFNAQGENVGGYRFMGLYKHNVYVDSATNIPIIRKKIQYILDQSGVTPATYNYAELSHILNTFPRDELFQASIEHLLRVSLEVLYLQERHKVKFFLRESLGSQFVSVIFYVPRDRLSSRLKEQFYNLLKQRIDSESFTSSTWFSESSLARYYLVFKLKSPLSLTLDESVIERKIIELARDWNEDLQFALSETFGEEIGTSLYRRYRNTFPASYIEENSPRIAVVDIERMQKIVASDKGNLALSFYQAESFHGTELKIKIYHQGAQLSLSEMVPVLENFGLEIIEQFPYDINMGNEDFWIYNFTVSFPSSEIKPEQYRDLLSDAFLAVWAKKADNDVFNQLILKAGLSWRQVNMLRAYARYMKQISLGFSQIYIASALIKYTGIARKLIALFDCRFNPFKKRAPKTAARLKEQLQSMFEAVTGLSEDRIVRRYLELITATLRTNYFQSDDQHNPKPYLSIKLNPQLISNMPLPRPAYEIFVYSPRFSGIHLRGGSVARGGLRWSDRTEDFRTEILGLVKAQQVKNAVIVPVGAKGGFVATRLPPAEDREAFWKEGIDCYRSFIRGLLDLTDNLITGKVQPPKDLVRYDGDDPYLVVAADKGTATFSDIANEISQEYNYWLGDAFASGGSNGYDHKKMGITARGAWVSVQRHFREIGIDIQKQAISVIGIGDMSGDVFGNGMLLSPQIRLVGAFNHLNIFIDPCPDAAKSFEERQRLFNLPRSSWQDYDTQLISKGGGVFSRSAKSVSLSPELQKLLNIKQKQLMPNELISLLLKADVDLLWNGGIGTYVKASHEQHIDVGDKANDGLRINANELHCKVVGEGGNLGLTQQARIEYALMGGSIFTDFIDNVGGVDCSDHEVNIKILLDKQIAEGDLTLKQRNLQLLKMTDSVSHLVLQNNYRQTNAISLANLESSVRLEEYRRVIAHLESSGKLNRQLEFLPDDEGFAERKSLKQGLTQPELSILISYVKADFKEALMETELDPDESLQVLVATAFPSELVSKFSSALYKHPLKREIIATQVANDIFNHMGIAFVYDLQQSVGVNHVDIAKVYIAAKQIFDMDAIWSDLKALDYQISSDLQYQMMLTVSRMVRRASRWLLKNHRKNLQVSQLVADYQEPIRGLHQQLTDLLPEPSREAWHQAREELINSGAPEHTASTLASCEYLYDFLGIIAASNKLNKDINTVASCFFALGERLELDDFSEHLEQKMPLMNHWQAMARESLRDDLEWQHRRLTQDLLKSPSAEKATLDEMLDQWLLENERSTSRWKQIMLEINNQSEVDIALFSVAIRELSDLNPT